MSRETIVGAALPRVDAADKVTGEAKYLDDMVFPRELHAALVLSPHPHARIVSVNTKRAAAMPGVVAVLTAADVPGANQIGCVVQDQPLLAVDRVRFVGDRVAVVVAETRDAARAAARAVRVRYRQLPAIFDPEVALAPDAPKLHESGNLIRHQKIRFGKGRDGFQGCDVVVEKEFSVNYQEHAYLEPQACAAVPDEGGMTIFGSMQCPFYVQGGVARVLGLDRNRVRVVQATTGGGFGGKEDYPSEVAACAAVAASATGRPVKLVYSRAEDMQLSTKRHRMKMRYRVGASRDGTLKALDARILVDAGGYVGLSTVVAERSNATAAGPYRFEHAHVDTLIVYTNNLFGGAFRGFGNPQVTFAIEGMMDLLAQKLGMDAIELRRRNLLRLGDRMVVGQRTPASAPSEQVLDLLVEKSRYRELLAAAEAFNRTSRWTRRGAGLALSLYGCCLHAGGQHMEGSAALVQVRADGSVEVSIGGAEIGQGAYTVAAQIAAETLGAPYDRVRVLPTDTRAVADSGPTVASRTTVMSGNAVRAAALQIRARLQALPAELTFAERCAAAFRLKMNMAASGWYAPPPKEWAIETGQGTAYVTYCFSGHVAEVEVDLVSGVTRVMKLVAVHDVGRGINPVMLEGQAHGGMVQGMGWATSENLHMDKGRCLNPGFTDYLVPTAMDAPDMEAYFVEDPYPDGPFGAKGIGEPSLISVPSAVAAAIGNACGFAPDHLPVTGETVLRWLHDRKEDRGQPEGGEAPPGESCRRLPFPLPD